MSNVTTPDGAPRTRPAPKKATKAPAAQGQITDLAGFAKAVLKGIGAPATPANVNFIMAWAHREGTAASANPLATTQRATGSTALPGNPSGVQQYGSYAQGVEATVQTLTNGNYGDLINAFRSGKADMNARYAGLKTWSLAKDGSYYDTVAGSPTQNVKLSAVGAEPTYTGGKAVQTQGDAENYVRANYGYEAAFLDDPVIGPILRTAAKNNYDQAQLLGLIYRTPAAKAWWTHNSDTKRQWDAEAKLDPAAHRQKIANQQAQILALAGQDGFNLDPTRAAKIANDSLAYGWSTDQIKEAVAHEYRYDPSASNETVANIKQDAYNYAVPISDQAIQTWAQKIMGGTATPDDFKAYAQQQAKSLYPTISAALDGVDTQTYADPYKQIAARELGVNPDSINLLEPKWQRALMTVNPDGSRTPMTLDQWTTTLRSDPQYGWGNTVEAQNAVSSKAATTISSMGLG